MASGQLNVFLSSAVVEIQNIPCVVFVLCQLNIRELYATLLMLQNSQPPLDFSATPLFSDE